MLHRWRSSGHTIFIAVSTIWNDTKGSVLLAGSSVLSSKAAAEGLSFLSLLLWASCMNALLMVWWLFAPTSLAGQACHPFYFGPSWYWSLLSVASFSPLAAISMAAGEKYTYPTYLGITLHTSNIQTSCKHWYGTAEWCKDDALQI